MVVRFDSKALQQTVERRTEPIGVEGDPPSTKKGGISEADALVKEARKSMGDVGRALPGDGILEEEAKRVDQEIIKEEEEKEPGPELHLDGVKQLAKVRQDARS